MATLRRDTDHSRNPQTPSTPAAVIDRAQAAALLSEVSRLITALQDGSIAIQDGIPARSSAQVAQEQRAREISAIFSPAPTMARTLNALDVEPRRQRKARTMPSRRLYSAAAIKSGPLLKAAMDLTPAAKSILVYLAHHPNSTVQDLVVQLDLKQKTVENKLSELSQRNLITKTITTGK